MPEFKSGRADMATRQLQYARALRAPYIAIRAELRRGIVDRGIFDGVVGAQPDAPSSATSEQLAPSFDADDLTPDEFRFDDPAGADERFMNWLRRQQTRGVLGTITRGDNIYIRRALSDGDRFALARLRENNISVQGNALPAEAFRIRTAGSQAAYAAMEFNRPLPASTVKLLFDRNFDQLEDITTDTAGQINRVLSEGLISGQNPRDIAEDLADRIDAVGYHRSTLLARHEILYAHNESSLARYGQQGVEKVDVLTSDPCEQCAAYAAGAPYPVAEARGGLPQHPRCVCCYSPVVPS
jgi:hypothetical protein